MKHFCFCSNFSSQMWRPWADVVTHVLRLWRGFDVLPNSQKQKQHLRMLSSDMTMGNGSYFNISVTFLLFFTVLCLFVVIQLLFQQQMITVVQSSWFFQANYLSPSYSAWGGLRAACATPVALRLEVGGAKWFVVVMHHFLVILQLFCINL